MHEKPIRATATDIVMAENLFYARNGVMFNAISRFESLTMLNIAFA